MSDDDDGPRFSIEKDDDDDGQNLDRNSEPMVLGPAPPVPVKRVRADALRRADTAWSARVAGATWKEAAELAGFSSAEHAIDGVKNAFGGVPQIDREELRNLWRDRLERSWRQVGRDMVDRVPGAA